MSDVEFIGETDPIPTTQDVAVAAPKARKRGPRKVAAAQLEPVDVIVSEPQEAPKRSRSTRAKKLNGKHVTDGVVQLGSLAAMMTGHVHWMIDPNEVAPWSAEAADLLNRIPSRYVESALSLSGFLIVGAGLYGVLGPRIEKSSKLMAESRTVQYDGPSEVPQASFTYEPFEGTP